MSHMVAADEDDSILDLKQIEDMMRTSQKSNIFSIPPLASEIGERGSASTFSRVQGPTSSDRLYRGVN